MLRLVVSQQVLEEVRRNLASSYPEKSAAFEVLVTTIEFEIEPNPSREEFLSAAEYVVLKDAPIVAAAINAKPDYFVTFDRKHLLEPPQVAARSGLKIVSPDVVIAVLNTPKLD